MIHATVKVPTPHNEPVLACAPGSAERATLKAKLAELAGTQIEVPLVIGGKRIHTGKTTPMTMPHDHGHVLGTFHEADASHIEQAIASAMAVKAEWAATPFHERAAIFLRAAELLATKYRPVLNAATMLGQSKTAYQAEIDSACEAIDFLRYNVHFASQLYTQQPESSAGVWNMMDYRPLDGFVFAVAPFNFTAIAANLCTSPAIMGNVVLMKPASTSVYSNWFLMELLREAGLPDGVINLVPGKGSMVGKVVLDHRDLGGIHFTGSTGVFNGMWKTVANNMDKYRQYPRLVGETGGKDFIFAHPSVADDLDALATAIVRGGYEFQGQKCSACSRVYVPESIWPRLKVKLQEMIAEIKVGDVRDFRNFMGAVIDKASFENTMEYIELARRSPDCTILAGGEGSPSKGWFIQPTLVVTTNPWNRLMVEEIFAPVVTLHVYPDAKYVETLRECDQAAAYALTGSIFARDRKAIAVASHELRHAAGNFYINDKPTGAVVGQQPFGGSRASGTNDKAGSFLNLIRWTSPRTIKETLVPPTRFGYPFMDAE